jgi:hypothetical protein
MDAAAFWQENKRWVIGVALGVMVYFLGKSIVGSYYDPAAVRRQARTVARQDQGTELYDRKAREAALAEGGLLAAELEKLRAELTFASDPRYQLEGKAMAPEDYLAQVGRALKQSVVQEANRLGVQVQDKDLQWPSPVVPDEIRGVLLGLELIDDATRRLFEAHRQAVKADPEVMGLRAIGQFRIEETRAARGPLPRPARPGDVDLRELLSQERVTFQFQCDAAVAFAFLEACRRPGKTLAIDALTMTQPTPAGEGITVKGTLLGVQFRKEAP